MFINTYATVVTDTYLVGDLNFRIDKAIDASAQSFSSIMEAGGMIQHVQESTHVKGHTLYVIVSNDSSYINDVTAIDPCLFDEDGNVSIDHSALMCENRLKLNDNNVGNNILLQVK